MRPDRTHPSSNGNTHLPCLQSASLIGSLCREMEGLRQRWAQVLVDRARCRDEILAARLQEELACLKKRREDLLQSVRILRCHVRDRLALSFLEELTRRPLVV